MVVHERDDGMAHIGVLEGRTLVEHYVALPTDDTTSIDGNIYLGPGPERAARHGSGVHRHRHTEERRALPRRRRPRRRRHRQQGTAPHRAGAAQRPVDHRAGHEEPDRAQGRAPHAGGEPRRPVRRHGAEPAADVRHLEAAPRRRAQAPAPDPRQAAPGRRRAHRAHRGRGRDRRRARARHAPSERAVAADLRARQAGRSREACSTRNRRSRSG